MYENTNTVYTIHTSQFAAFDAKVEEANRKLERNGIESRFSYEIVDADYAQAEDSPIIDVYADIVFNHASLELGGWEFVATVAIEEGGTMLRTAPGQSLEGWDRPDSHRCDHCNVNMARKVSYVVRNTETGEIAQVGRNCLEIFLGVGVKGLNLLTMFTAEELAEYREADYDRFVSYGSRGQTTFDARFMIALAYTLSEGGAQYVSKANAELWDKESTSEKAITTATWIPGRSRDPQTDLMMAERNKEAAAFAPSETVTEILTFAETLADNDYGMNVKAAARSSFVSYQALGVLMSLVAVWYRANNEAKRSDKVAAAEGYIADVKVRVRDLAVTVENVTGWETDYGWTSLIIFRTEDQHVLTWKTGSATAEVGEKFSLTGTVKEHTKYNGVDQTVVTRCKLVEVA